VPQQRVSLRHRHFASVESRHLLSTWLGNGESASLWKRVEMLFAVSGKGILFFSLHLILFDAPILPPPKNWPLSATRQWQHQPLTVIKTCMLSEDVVNPSTHVLAVLHAISLSSLLKFLCLTSTFFLCSCRSQNHTTSQSRVIRGPFLFANVLLHLFFLFIVNVSVLRSFSFFFVALGTLYVLLLFGRMKRQREEISVCIAPDSLCLILNMRQQRE